MGCLGQKEGHESRRCKRTVHSEGGRIDIHHWEEIILQNATNLYTHFYQILSFLYNYKYAMYLSSLIPGCSSCKNI